MSKAIINQLDIFHELSSTLTDFNRIDLLGTGVGQEYLDELILGAGEKQVKDLLEAAKNSGNSTANIRKDIWDHARFGPMARNIVLMWYLGSWYPLSESWHKKNRPDFKPLPEHVVSSSAYQEALWAPTVGAHPRGAKPPGFGSWEKKPSSIGTKTGSAARNAERKANNEAEAQQVKNQPQER